MRNFCSSCKHDFTSLTAFDRHRTGSYKHNTRRCMSEQEMIDQGLEQKSSELWGIPANPRFLLWKNKLHSQPGRKQSKRVDTSEPLTRPAAVLLPVGSHGP